MTDKIASILGASCIGILLGAVALLWSPMTQAQSTFSPAPQVQSSQPAKIDRMLPGSKEGIATRAERGTVWIDGARYVLVPGALVEKKSGSAVLPEYLKWEGVAFNVQYWLEPGATDNQITQLIITFPE